ncbi:RluA family pseudouridine synthase [Thalassobaculum sp.]|uniref:RluA family pseudouridine synthase n=1 Tax=Thalassobaculum sp. TaxID=2022740 RepID=UPI003B5A6F7B
MSAYVETRVVAQDEAEQRLDRWFKRHFPAVGHGQLSKLLRTGQVRIDGKRAKANQRLEAGQTIRIPPLGDTPTDHTQFARPARRDSETGAELQEAVLYRDDEMIAINKPAGLAVQGGSGTTKHVDGALDSLRYGAKERPRLVHRLDKDTSGVLVLARDQRAARRLTHAFRAKSAMKIYWALVVGEPKPAAGQIELPIGKLPGKAGEKMVVDHETGKSAVTRYVTLEKLGRRAALVALFPVTGRTHQLRVHMAAIGTPILGDGKYGGAEAFLQGEGVSRKLHLHARAIRIPDEDGVPVEVIAPLQDHMIRSFDFFGLEPELDGSPFEPFED